MFNMIEVFLRDLAVYLDTEDVRLLTNADQIDTIKKFTGITEKRPAGSHDCHRKQFPGVGISKHSA